MAGAPRPRQPNRSGMPSRGDFRLPWNYPEGTYSGAMDIPADSLGASRSPASRQQLTQGQMTPHNAGQLPPPPTLHPQEMRMYAPPRREQPWRGTSELTKDLEKRDAKWKKEEKKLRKAQEKARKELQKLHEEMRSMSSDLRDELSDVRGEPRGYRGLLGQAMQAPPPPPPMPRMIPPSYQSPPPPPMARNLPQERLVPPGYQQGVQLPETVYQPPAPPASSQYQPVREGLMDTQRNRLNPWSYAGQYPFRSQYDRTTYPR